MTNEELAQIVFIKIRTAVFQIMLWRQRENPDDRIFVSLPEEIEVNGEKFKTRTFYKE